MRPVALICLVFVAGVLAVAPSRAPAAEIKTELQDFETGAEKRLRDNLKSLLGAETEPVVIVHAEEQPPAAPTPGSKPTPKDGGLDLGYLPIPIQDTDLVIETRKFLNIGSVDVDITLPGIEDAKAPKVAKELAEKMLAKYRPTVRVKMVALPIKKDPNREPAADKDKEKDKEKKAEPFDPKTLFPLAAALLAAAIIAFGISTIARAVHQSAETLSLGFVNLRPSAPAPERPRPAVKDDPTRELTKVLPPPPNQQRSRSESQALKVVKQAIKLDSTLLTRAISDSEPDQRGLRRLLPFLEEEEQQLLKQAFGAHRLKRLTHVKDAPEGEDSEQEFGRWMQRLSEKILVRKIQGGSEVDRALGADRVLRFMEASPQSLLAAAKAVNSRAAWRIATEFLPKDRFARALSDAAENEWTSLIGAAETPEQELQGAAEQLASALEQSQGADESEAAEQRKSYYAGHLLEPVIAAIRAKAPGEDDGFLLQIEQNSPDLARLVRERVWTSIALNRVPDSWLAETVKALSNDERMALIMALPKEYSERVRAMIPEGNARVIVLDKLKKALAKNSPELAKEAAETVRSVLERLRQEAASGDFELMPEGTIPQIPQTQQTNVTQAAA